MRVGRISRHDVEVSPANVPSGTGTVQQGPTTGWLTGAETEQGQGQEGESRQLTMALTDKPLVYFASTAVIKRGL